MKKNAFTLAEVLITLGIIGVVAALTLPSLIENYKERQYIIQLKKAYSTIAQAYEKATWENETPDTWGLTGQDTKDPDIILGVMSQYIKQLKICNASQGCWPQVHYLQQNGVPGANINMATTYGKAIINDGMLMYIFSRNMQACNGNRGKIQEYNTVCATVTIDVNGYKLPNTFGKDTFSFIMSKSGIYPQGSPDDIIGNTLSMTTYCNSTRDGNRNSGTNGLACTAWVLQNENMDYLHCNGISWNGKKKCN